MFGRWRFQHDRPAYAWGGGYVPDAPQGWQPWAQPERPPFGPPWAGMRRPPFGPPFGGMFWHMARHFPFGPGRGPMGPRFFERGDLKYALLALLRERPKHGYEMMKELEEQASGFYTPSAGAIYPTLQLMEDRGWVTSQVVDGKRVYTITDVGRQELEAQNQRAQAFGGPRGWGGHRHGYGGPFGRQAQPELGALRQETEEVARLLWASVMAAGGDPEKLARLRAIIGGTRNQLNEFLGQSPTGASGESAAPASGTVEEA